MRQDSLTAAHYPSIRSGKKTQLSPLLFEVVIIRCLGGRVVIQSETGQTRFNKPAREH